MKTLDPAWSGIFTGETTFYETIIFLDDLSISNKEIVGQEKKTIG
jgi:hypothetical protein